MINIYEDRANAEHVDIINDFLKRYDYPLMDVSRIKDTLMINHFGMNQGIRVSKERTQIVLNTIVGDIE